MRLTATAPNYTTELQAHVRRLCDKLGVLWDTDATLLDNEAFPDVIVSPAVSDTLTYFAALHELGHLARRGAWLTHVDLPLVEEIEAWSWALSHALIHPDEPAIVMIAQALEGYCRDASR